MDERWLAVLSRITPSEPMDLDLLAKAGSSVCTGRGWPDALPADRSPSAKLWDRGQEPRAYMGIRLNAPLADTAAAAIRLASAALERGINPIILTVLDNSGFERFGFRVERIRGDSEAERAACEAELIGFWNMAIVIDAADVAGLG